MLFYDSNSDQKLYLSCESAKFKISINKTDSYRIFYSSNNDQSNYENLSNTEDSLKSEETIEEFKNFDNSVEDDCFEQYDLKLLFSTTK